MMKYTNLLVWGKTIIFVILMLFISLSISAERKKVGIVFGGGGVKGAVHVGVMRVLQEEGIPMDYIAGTSIGAIVGSFYAMGYSTNEIDSLIHHLDWNFLISDKTSKTEMLYSSRKKAYEYIFSIPFQKQLTIPAGIINGQNILNLLKGLTAKFHGYDSFLDLPVPFSCVATDIAQGNYAVLSEGNLPLSVRASMSIPAIFLPVQIDSMILVDGGVMNNLPTNVVKDMGADITIGIDLSSGPVPYKELTTFYGMATKLLDMLGEEEYEKNVKALDLCLHPDLSNFSTMDFTPEVIDSLYRIGINIARENLPRIRALRKEIYGDDYDFSQIVEDTVPVSTWNWDEKFPISSIRFDSIPAKDRDWFLKKTGLREHSEVSINEINNAISILQGLDVFSTITYNLEGKENPELVFVVKKKAQQQLNFGFRFDTESMASILLNTTFTNNFFRGIELSVTTRLNKNPYLNLGLKWGEGIMNQIGINYVIGYHSYNLYKHKKRIDNVEYLWQKGEIKYIGTFKNLASHIGMEWSYFGYNNEVYNTDYNPLKITPGSFFNYFARFYVDSYENRYFPTDGWFGYLEAKIITDNFLTYKGKSPVGTIQYDIERAISFSPKFTIIPGISGRLIWSDEVPAIYQNYAGGNLAERYLQQQLAFPGIRNLQIFKEKLLITDLQLRYQFLKKSYAYLIGYYGFQGDEFGEIKGKDKMWSAAAQYSYESPVGPLILQVNYSGYVKEVNVYISLGFNF